MQQHRPDIEAAAPKRQKTTQDVPRFGNYVQRDLEAWRLALSTCESIASTTKPDQPLYELKFYVRAVGVKYVPSNFPQAQRQLPKFCVWDPQNLWYVRDLLKTYAVPHTEHQACHTITVARATSPEQLYPPSRAAALRLMLAGVVFSISAVCHFATHSALGSCHNNNNNQVERSYETVQSGPYLIPLPRYCVYGEGLMHSGRDMYALNLDIRVDALPTKFPDAPPTADLNSVLYLEALYKYICPDDFRIDLQELDTEQPAQLHLALHTQAAAPQKHHLTLALERIDNEIKRLHALRNSIQNGVAFLNRRVYGS